MGCTFGKSTAIAGYGTGGILYIYGVLTTVPMAAVAMELLRDVEVWMLCILYRMRASSSVTLDLCDSLCSCTMSVLIHCCHSCPEDSLSSCVIE